MPIFLLRYAPQILGAVAVVGILAFAGYRIHSHGEVAGRAIVQRAWDNERAEIARQTALQEAEARQKEEADRKAAKEVQDALQQRLASADASARDLARRLRDYQARDRQRRLSEAAGSAPSPGGAPGESSDSGAVGQLLEEHLAACGRDAERLAGWQEWWSKVSE